MSEVFDDKVPSRRLVCPLSTLQKLQQILLQRVHQGACYRPQEKAKEIKMQNGKSKWINIISTKPQCTKAVEISSRRPSLTRTTSCQLPCHFWQCNRCLNNCKSEPVHIYVSFLISKTSYSKVSREMIKALIHTFV